MECKTIVKLQLVDKTERLGQLDEDNASILNPTIPLSSHVKNGVGVAYDSMAAD